jgi:hypothetical protein
MKWKQARQPNGQGIIIIIIIIIITIFQGMFRCKETMERSFEEFSDGSC